MIVDYQMVSPNKVNDWIAKGYQPYGTPFVTTDRLDAQAVVLEDSANSEFKNDVIRDARAASLEALVRTGNPDMSGLLNLIAQQKADVDKLIGEVIAVREEIKATTIEQSPSTKV